MVQSQSRPQQTKTGTNSSKLTRTLFGYGNIEWQENLMGSNACAGSSPASTTKSHVYQWLDCHPDKMKVGSSNLPVTTKWSCSSIG